MAPNLRTSVDTAHKVHRIFSSLRERWVRVIPVSDIEPVVIVSAVKWGSLRLCQRLLYLFKRGSVIGGMYILDVRL